MQHLECQIITAIIVLKEDHARNEINVYVATHVNMCIHKKMLKKNRSFLFLSPRENHYYNRKINFSKMSIINYLFLKLLILFAISFEKSTFFPSFSAGIAKKVFNGHLNTTETFLSCT